MTNLRRRAVLLAGLFFLHLTVAVSGAQCVLKSIGDPAGSAMAASMPGMADEEARPASSPSTSHGQLPSDGKRVPTECTTSAPCAIAILPAAGEKRVSVEIPNADRTRVSMLAPQSRSVTPEPPPPRA